MTSTRSLLLGKPPEYTYSGSLSIFNSAAGPIQGDPETARVERILNGKKVVAVFDLIREGKVSRLATITLKEADKENSEEMFPTHGTAISREFKLKLPENSSLNLQVFVDNSLAASREIFPFGVKTSQALLYPAGRINILPSPQSSPTTSPITDRPASLARMTIEFLTTSACISLKRIEEAEETDA